MRIQGSICALATPFDVEGQLDFDGFSKLIGCQLEQGTQALVVAGSTGEAHMLADEELAGLLQHAVKQVAGKVPVVAGCGAASTRSTVEACIKVADWGADAALVVTPYYVRPDQRGLEQHFCAVADDSPLPVILYNVPSRTACDMQPETVAVLRDHPRIIGIKDAVPDVERQQALAALAGDDFVYLSGDDATAMQAMLAGAQGTVSVVANAVPGLFRALCDAACAGDDERAMACMARIEPLLAALACGPNPVPVKAALAALGVCGDTVRLPLVKLTDNEALKVLNDCVRELASRSPEDWPAGN